MQIDKIKTGDENSKSDLISSNIQKLKELFPEIWAEGKIDFKILQEILGNEIENEEEYYRFTWAGKAAARREAHKPSTGTLRPAKYESIDWETTQNIYIEGDNLEVLKLLQKSYSGKIKMIYIDPPYNTGEDFIYKDNYKDNLHNYQEITGQTDSEGIRLTTNRDKDGRYHSNWLNMIYPRLLLAKNLLREDGVIFISIGVEEFSNLKALLSEIFGEENFVEIFSWVKTSTPPALSKKSRKTNEYIICFEKNKNNILFNGSLLDGGDQPLLNSGNSSRELTFPKEKVFFSENSYQNGKISAGKTDRVTLKKDLDIINGYASEDFILEGEFKWTQDFLNEEISKGTTFIIKSEKLSIRFLRDETGYKRPTNFIKENDFSPLINKKENGVGTNENASKYLANMLGGDYFDYPKPVSLIQYLINFSCSQNDLVLDFFAGSSTTGEAVYRYNMANNTSLKYILVQLPEVLDTKNASDSNEKVKIQNCIHFLSSIDKPSVLSEIGKERIRRAAKKIAEENPDKAKELDLGFKVFKLDSSNIKGWDGNPENLEQSLFDSEENIKTDRTEEDVLFEILLKYGFDLTQSITEKEVDGKKIFNAGKGKLFICLAEGINATVAEAIGEWRKEELLQESKKGSETISCRVVFRDSGFSDVEKTNTVHTLKRFGINEIKSI